MNNVHYSSKSEEWSTPLDFFQKLNKEFVFDLDPCATKENHKCFYYFTKEQDGLKQSWGGVHCICKSSIRKGYKKLGTESIRGVTKTKYYCGDVAPSKNRYVIFSQLHIPQSRGTFYQGSIKVWRQQKLSTVSKYDSNI